MGFGGLNHTDNDHEDVIVGLRARLKALEWERERATQYWYSGGSHGPDILVEAPNEDESRWTVVEEDGKSFFATRDEALAKFRALIEEAS
jgi:hypothetical protein